LPKLLFLSSHYYIIIYKFCAVKLANSEVFGYSRESFFTLSKNIIVTVFN